MCVCDVTRPRSQRSCDCECAETELDSLRHNASATKDGCCVEHTGSSIISLMLTSLKLHWLFNARIIVVVYSCKVMQAHYSGLSREMFFADYFSKGIMTVMTPGFASQRSLILILSWFGPTQRQLLSTSPN